MGTVIKGYIRAVGENKVIRISGTVSTRNPLFTGHR